MLVVKRKWLVYITSRILVPMVLNIGGFSELDWPSLARCPFAAAPHWDRYGESQLGSLRGLLAAVGLETKVGGVLSFRPPD
jgi:hypothetical protein